MKYPNLEKLEPGDLWRWCNYRADTIVCSEQIEADQHGWRQAADLIHDRGVELARAADMIERLIESQAKELSQHRSELRGAHDAMEALAKALTKTEQERDAALAEVERLKVDIKGEALKMVEDMYPSEYIR